MMRMRDVYKRQVFEQDLQQKDQEMYDLKHELISLRMQIEEAQKHEQEADVYKRQLHWLSPHLQPMVSEWDLLQQ